MQSLAVRAVAPDLVALPVHPPLGAARFGLVTLASRSEAPTLPLLREVIAERMPSDDRQPVSTRGAEAA